MTTHTDGQTPRTEADVEYALLELLAEADSLDDRFNDVEARTFSEGGVLTRNRGLEVRFPNGAAFQLTIVQSASSEEGED